MMAERWEDIDRDMASARRHLGNGVSLFRSRIFGQEPPDEADEMAFMHMMQSGYTSFESGLKRTLLLLGEKLPQGSQSHADLLDRFRRTAGGTRPTLFDEKLFRAATELRKFRHVAIHTYDYLDHDRAVLLVRDADLFLAEIGSALARFRAAVDPD